MKKRQKQKKLRKKLELKSQQLLKFRKKNLKFCKEITSLKLHKKPRTTIFSIRYWKSTQLQLKTTNLWPQSLVIMPLKHALMFGPKRKNLIVSMQCRKSKTFSLNFGLSTISCRKMFLTIMKPTLCSRILQSTNEG